MKLRIFSQPLPTMFCCLAAYAALGSSTAKADTPVDFHWRRVQPWSYVATPVALGTAFYLRFGAPPPGADWKGGILLDDAIRERVALDSPEARSMMETVTDIDFFGSMAYRLVDSALVPAVGYGALDTSLQMSMIDLESFGFVAITLWGTQAILGRERPLIRRCGERGFADCESARSSNEANRSFYSGHPAVGLTAAGLTCTHHAYLPLYGGGAADTIACGTMVGAAVINGFGRVMIEKHYASDLAVGFGVGVFAGWVMPRLLHYDHPRARLATTSASPVRVTVLPAMGQRRVGIAAVGIW